MYDCGYTGHHHNHGTEKFPMDSQLDILFCMSKHFIDCPSGLNTPESFGPLKDDEV